MIHTLISELHLYFKFLKALQDSQQSFFLCAHLRHSRDTYKAKGQFKHHFWNHKNIAVKLKHKDLSAQCFLSVE